MSIPLDKKYANMLKGDYRQILLSGHGVTPMTATKEQVKNALIQLYDGQKGFHQDQAQAFKDFFLQTFVKEREKLHEIKRIVKDSIREAFYTKKDNFLISDEFENMLTESIGEYLKDIGSELNLWLEGKDKQLLKESMSMYIKGFTPKDLRTTSKIAWEIEGQIYKLIEHLPEDQKRYYRKNRTPELLTIDGYNPDLPIGILNFYTAGLTRGTMVKAMKLIFDQLKKLGIKYGKVKTEQSKMFNSPVVRINITGNPYAHSYFGPPEVNMANANAFQIFHNVLQYPGENNFSMKASELMERIESLAHDKEWIDKNKINPTDSALGKDQPFDDPEMENPRFDIVNQLGAGGARMVSPGLSGGDIRDRLGMIWNFARWAASHGYEDIYVA